jgi:hypothetical protein
VGAFAVCGLRSTAPPDVHTPVDGEEAIPRTSYHYYLVNPSKAKAAAKSLLCAASGGATWNAQPALLQSRLSLTFVLRRRSAPPSGRVSDVARLEIHTQAALQNTSSNGFESERV